MLKHAKEFYKKLFGEEEKENIRLGEDFWNMDEKISCEENEALEADLSKEEVRRAIVESYAEGAPGPDDFSFLFYQKFWLVIKIDLMNLVKAFEKDGGCLYRLNYALITPIPKEEGARTLKKFRPIRLINCSFKFFAKALNNRLVGLCDRLLSCNHIAFVKCKFILESVVSAHEIIHETVKSNIKGIVLKLDYEKAYDRLNWSFLEEMMVSRGFGPGLEWVYSN
jgi:hypothetical protein